MTPYRSLSVGDIVPDAAAGRAPIVTQGPARWIALTVLPQREDQAEAWLALRGVYAFHPVLMRRVTVRGHARDYARRYLPGYVFARFQGEPVRHLVMACDYITGALCDDRGGWGALASRELRALHAMRRVDAAAEARRSEAAERRRRAALVRAGDGALFRCGVFAGQTCEVVELRADGGAVVRLSLFGGEITAQARTEDMVPVRRIA